MAFATVQDGHKALAYAFKSSANLWMARGTLPVGFPGVWGISDTPPESLTSVSIKETVQKGYEGSLDKTTFSPVVKIYEITDTTGELVYPEDSYLLDNSGIQWNVGHQQPNSGDDYLVSYRYFNNNITELVDEVDRIKVSSMFFVEEDPEGDIEAGGLRWSFSNETTPFVYCLWKFPAAANLGRTIYQLGVYTGTTTINPDDENSIKVPDDLDDPGKLFMIDNIRPFTTTENIRLYVELIISF